MFLWKLLKMAELEISRDSWKKIKYNLRRSFDGVEENLAKCVRLYEEHEPDNSATAMIFYDAIRTMREQWESSTVLW